ncbi:MAG: Unknown protein [uncultured Aureispira sp.]|uniref:SGNH/GDSL hydrolase family protein n=1 Tax=uncultured Aureispira sp. TaxID=1331704 RepID=A0A6S6UIG4_9BACT|nr:MAG: Unknown protein [uncultured Aureispira sp.]
MKRIIFQTTIFILITGVSFLLILCQADGYSDAFYLKFTTKPQTNLILGTSRAAQGLQPLIFDAILKKEAPFFNYAFTLAQSPFGAVYLNSIQKKLDTTKTKATFIVTVDPWTICSETKNPNDSTNFREVELALANTENVNVKPNLGYLYHNYGGKYHQILFPINSKMYLHEEGWLEMNLRTDTATIRQRTLKKIKDYRYNVLPKYKFSSLRLQYLIKTIQYLNKYGEVFLVRIPVSEKMMEIENELMSDFDFKIKEAILLSKDYLDLTKENSSFTYTDGNHLYKKSGAVVSEKIANWVKSK